MKYAPGRSAASRRTDIIHGNCFEATIQNTGGFPPICFISAIQLFLVASKCCRAMLCIFASKLKRNKLENIVDKLRSRPVFCESHSANFEISWDCSLCKENGWKWFGSHWFCGPISKDQPKGIVRFWGWVLQKTTQSPLYSIHLKLSSVSQISTVNGQRHPYGSYI